MDSLSAETLTLIQNTAVKASDAASKVAFVSLPSEPKHVYAAVKPDGSWERKEAVASPRAHRLACLFEAIAFANTKGTEEGSVIWFDDQSLTVILDDQTRRDVAVLAFHRSPQFARVETIAESKENFNQAAFRRLLRVDFHGCRPNDLLLDWISDCEFGGNKTAAGMIAKDKSSFGREINEQATSKDRGQCPDEIQLSMPVFDDPGLRTDRAVLCDVEILFSEEKFRLTPFPGEIKAAVDAELANIEALLSGEGGVKCPVFRGKP